MSTQNTCVVKITTSCINNLGLLIKDQITIDIDHIINIKNLIDNYIVNKLPTSDNIIFSPEFKKSINLMYFGNILEYDAILQQVDLHGQHEYCFGLHLSKNIIPICIQIQNHDKKFIFLNNQTCSSAIKLINDHVYIGNVIIYKQFELSDTVNSNKKLSDFGFHKYIFEHNVLTHKQNNCAKRQNTITENEHNNVKRNKKKYISASKKTDVWNKYIGESIGKSLCTCCKSKDITSRNFHVGHIVAEANGGTLDIFNLRPICAQCNLSMRTENMYEFMEKNKWH